MTTGIIDAGTWDLQGRPRLTNGKAAVGVFDANDARGFALGQARARSLPPKPNQPQDVRLTLDSLSRRVLGELCRGTLTPEQINAMTLGEVKNSLDSFSPTGGPSINVNDFVTVWSDIVREFQAELEFTRYFNAAPGIPENATEFEIRAEYVAGGARLWYGGDDLPVASHSRESARRPVRTIAAAVKLDTFDRQWESGLGIDAWATDMRTQLRAIEELSDEILWQGAEQHDLHGLMNLPGQPRQEVTGITFGPAISTVADFNAAKVAILGILQSQYLTHQGRVGNPDTCYVSPRFMTYMTTQVHPEQPNLTLFAAVNAVFRGNITWSEIPYLTGSGPGGLDVMIVGNKADFPEYILPGGLRATPIIPEGWGFMIKQAMYRRIGGVRMRPNGKMRTLVAWVNCTYGS